MRAINFGGHDKHAHDYPLLIQVVSGSVIVELENESITVAANSGLWLAPGVEHAAYPQRKSIMFGPRLSPHTIPPARHLLIVDNLELRELALLILATSPSTEAEREPFRLALDEILAGLITEDFFIPVIDRPEVRLIADDPMALLVSLKSLAERHGKSPRHIERLFKDNLGMTFVQWRTRRRLNLALHRIRSGLRPRSAARSVGYDSADGLIKALQRLTGLSRGELAEDPASAVLRWRTDQESTDNQDEPSLTL